MGDATSFSALSTATQEDTAEDSRASKQARPRLALPHLFLVLECDRPDAGGCRHALAGIEEVLIGRGQIRCAERSTRGGLNTLTIRVSGPTMSSRHARLRATNEGWLLEDIGSKNGSYVNGKPVVRALVRDGDVIELGQTVFLLRDALLTPPETMLDFDPVACAGGAPDQATLTLLPGLSREFEAFRRCAASSLPMLLFGQTGTGKELLARAAHRLSNRPGPFLGVNCGALPSHLVESLLFGHTKGAFSGATRDEPGFIRSAHRGTLLLDEVGDLPAGAQTALLRAIEEEEVTPIGSARPIPIDVRIVAATHRALEKQVAAGTFRADLLARLDGYRFELPVLADRREDLGLIVRNVLAQASQATSSKFEPHAGVALVAHGWPYNTRELVQRLKRALVLSHGGSITANDLGLPAGAAPCLGEAPLTTVLREPQAGNSADAALERQIRARLRETGGNVAAVARDMKRARMQIQRWMKRFGIEPDEFRPIHFE